MADRRRQPRAIAHHPVAYQCMDREDISVHQGTTLNLSDGGLALVLGDELRIDETLALEIDPGDGKRALQAVAKVAWCEPYEEGGFRVGVEFLWIDSPTLSMATSMMPLVPWPFV